MDDKYMTDLFFAFFLCKIQKKNICIHIKFKRKCNIIINQKHSPYCDRQKKNERKYTWRRIMIIAIIKYEVGREESMF